VWYSPTLEVGGGHALVAVLELELPRQLLELVADDRAVRQPQRQALADVVVDDEDVELPAELLVVARLRLPPRLDVRLELLLGGEGPRVDAGHHHVVGVAPPVRPGERAQLERALRQLAGVVDVGALAHVEEGAVAVEGQLVEALLLEQLRGVFRLVGLAHLLQAIEGGLAIELLHLEGLALLDDLLHLPLDLREVLLGQRLGQDEVVVEAVGDGRAEAQRRPRAELQHGLGQHVRETVSDTVQLVLVGLCVEVVVHGCLPVVEVERGGDGERRATPSWTETRRSPGPPRTAPRLRPCRVAW